LIPDAATERPALIEAGYARDNRRRGCAPARGRLAPTSAAASVMNHE
jgi:hypothetical protein